MRAEELMRGNLVLYKGEPWRVTRIAGESIGLFCLSRLRAAPSVPVENVSPIPLSIEILEKNFNGAVENRDGLTCINYNLNKNSFIQAFAGGFYLCARVDDSKHHFHDEICIKELESVHQLQQFLTFYGIEKEIILDGVIVDIPLEPLP